MSLTPEQLELRRQGVTATDISALCGLNPYKSAMAVYLDKIGEPIEREDSEAMYWGNALEGSILQRYALDMEEEEGASSKRTVQGHEGTLQANVRSWAMCTPDAFVCRWPLAEPQERLWGIELKTAGAAEQVKRWGRGGDQVPYEYLCQCAWSMAVCELPRWDIAVLLATYHGLEYRQYTLTRDLDLERDLIKVGRDFHYINVAQRIPPHPDGSLSSARAIRRLYPEDNTPIAPATDTADELAHDLWIANQDYADANTERERLRQELMGEIQFAEGVQGRDFKITWKRNAKGNRVFRTTGKLFDRKVAIRNEEA